MEGEREVDLRGAYRAVGYGRRERIDEKCRTRYS